MDLLNVSLPVIDLPMLSLPLSLQASAPNACKDNQLESITTPAS